MDDFKWLHLSDFHTGKDNYAQIKLFTYILEHIEQMKGKGIVPNAVFITGDIANKGQKEEYDIFSEEFIKPLAALFAKPPKIYIVPGNHDLDRNKCKTAARSLHDILNDADSRFFDPDKNGIDERKDVFERFENFLGCFGGSGQSLCFPADGMFGEKGSFTDIFSAGKEKIGIVGINTAWLSKSDADKEKLTPGKYILEEALGEVKECKYKFVLGHHPLDWMQDEQRRQIMALLVKNKAFYLHGHLHRNGGGFLLARNSERVLTLQSGAAFQAREDEKYYNSLQWGRLCFQKNEVGIMPKKWLREEQEFVVEASEERLSGGRKDGQDEWHFSCDATDRNDESEEDKKRIKKLEGWCVVDREFIGKRVRPSDDEILKYFDGREPSYNDIFSSSIPSREIVTTIKDEFIRCNDENRTKCVLITGAGGEGKTTVMLQVVRELTENRHWRALVLRHSEKRMDLQEEAILEITKKGSWILCADNCFPITGKLFKLLKMLSARTRQNVHLLLCARDTDWSISKSEKYSWGEYADYRAYKLRGVSEKDAEKIVTAWGSFGERGLGELRDLSIPEAKEKLCLSAKGEMDKRDEGALLGAMLTVRHGGELTHHVRNMLLNLKKIPIKKGMQGSLLDAFAYIVAMHSKGLHFLSKAVMAQLFDFKTTDVKRYILTPLGDEAATAVSGELIHVRHMLIAQAARDILEEEMDYDFDEMYVELTKAAMEARKKGEYIECFSEWKYIGDNFMEENHTQAIRLCRAVLEVFHNDPHMTVHLSKIYRELGEYEMALDLFQALDERVEHRSLFCEWALVEANMGDKHTSVCLSALALSDQAEKQPIDPHNACVNLYSIALTFHELYTQYKNDDYLRASLSAIRLGEKIDGGDKNIQKFINGTLPKFDPKILNENLEYDECLKRGILTAAECAKPNFKDWIPRIDTLEYKRLFALA